MRLKQFWVLFFSTLGIGMVSGFVCQSFHLLGNLPVYYGFVIGGFVSATSLMGFWAYLMLNFTARSFLHRSLWKWIQMLLIVVVLYDVIYFRHLRFGDSESWAPYIWFGLIPFLWALIVAAAKVMLSDQSAYIPTVFYIFVFSILEWFVAIKANVSVATETIGIVLLMCNTWLILILGKLLTISRNKQKSAI